MGTGDPELPPELPKSAAPPATPPAANVPPTGDYSSHDSQTPEKDIGDMIAKTVTILQSPTVYNVALRHNIEISYNSLTADNTFKIREKQLEERERKLEEEKKELKEKLTLIEDETLNAKNKQQQRKRMA